MAQILLLCLILANAYMGLGMANEKTHTTQSSSSPILPNPPAPSPSNEATMIRKLGKHQHKATKFSDPPALSPSKETTSSEQAPMEAVTEENLSIQEEIHHRMPHRSVDKSVAGGGVILGGLATTFLVAIFCYIRATRRSHKAAEIASLNASPTASSK